MIMGIPMAHLRIRTKLWLGVGMLLLIIALVALVVWNSLARVQAQAHAVTNEIQPSMLDAMELARELDAANKSLGFYLLSLETEHRDAYLRSLRQAEELLVSLRNAPVARDNTALTAKLEELSKSVARFNDMRERMLSLAGNNIENIPAFAHAAEHLNPPSLEIAQMLSQMVSSERGERVSESRRELLLLLGDMRYSWVNVMSAMRGYLAFRTDATYSEVTAWKNNFTRQLEELDEFSGLLTFEQEMSLDELRATFALFDNNFPELARIHGSERWRTDAYLIRTELGESLRLINRDLSSLLATLRTATDSHSTSLMEQTNNTRNMVSLMALLALVIGVFTVWLLSRLIVTPINMAAATMDDIARGGGDLTCRLSNHSKDELGGMCAAFNRFVGKIREIIGPVRESTEHLAEAADSMASITHQTRTGVQRQQREIEQVAAAMNQMVATAQDMMDSAGMAADATAQADEEARAGAKVVSLTVKQINTLADAVAHAAEVIHRLEEDSSDIGKVLDVIGGIAEQTNLLALNAAIEAARAGEQGRGFAVVADEVRNLATRTQDSTSEIQQMIEKLQAGANEAVQVMVKGREQASSSVEQAKHAGESLQTIAKAVTRIRDMNQHMADAARQQGEVAGEINRNLVTITEVAEQTAEGAASLEQASERLSGMSHQLQSLVGHFKT